MTGFTAIPFDTAREALDVQRDVYLRMGGAGRVALMFLATVIVIQGAAASPTPDRFNGSRRSHLE
jgi:hypothetical protein